MQFTEPESRRVVTGLGDEGNEDLLFNGYRASLRRTRFCRWRVVGMQSDRDVLTVSKLSFRRRVGLGSNWMETGNIQGLDLPRRALGVSSPVL